MPPRSVRIDGGAGIGENRRRGSATWSRSVVDPAVTESAVKFPGRFIRPGTKSMATEPLVAPVSRAEEMSAASCKPCSSSLNTLTIEKMKSLHTSSMLIFQARRLPSIPDFVYRNRFREKCR